MKNIEENNTEAYEEDAEMYEHFNLKVDKGQELIRIDKFLVNRIENASRTKIKASAENGNILVNNKPVKPNYRIKPFDVISIVLPNPPRDTDLLAEEIPLDIVYEDNDIILINKQAGMVVHPAYGNYRGTLINALLFHFKNLPHSQENKHRPGLVHRIDKDTSGIIILAKNDFSMANLANQFFERTINRKYVAICWGNLKEDNGTIRANLGRNPKNRKQMTVYSDPDAGKHAVTHYKVIERFKYLTMVECKLETGRTHQIRVHFQHIGHPLFGDELYGGNRVLKGQNTGKYKQFAEKSLANFNRQALHAKSLEFKHPTSGKTMFFDSELPDDMKKIIDDWRNI